MNKRTSINFKVSVNFNLRTKTPKNILTTIRPIVRYNGHRIVLSSGCNIKPKDWNEGSQKTRGTQMYDVNNHITINERIDHLESKIKSIFNAFTDKHSRYPEPDVFKSLVESELNKTGEAEEQAPVIDLIAFTELFILESKTGLRTSERGKPLAEASIKIYNTFKKNLQEFKQPVKKDGKVIRGEYNLSFDNIGLEFFEDLRGFMITEKKYNTNTVAKHVRTLKTIMFEAKERGLTTVVFGGKRYRAITEETDSIYLTETELNALNDLDLSRSPRLDRVRDLFLVGCYTGLRFSDFTNITSRNIVEKGKGKFIDIQMQKTGNSVAIPILPEVEAIMKKYHGKTDNSLPPDDISNQKMNEYLKEIGELAASNDVIKLRYPKAAFNENVEQSCTKAGMPVTKYTPKYKLITCHTARRSFATNAYHRHVPVLSIMSITGHRTETSFMKYIKVTPMEHAEIMMDIFRRSTLLVVNL